jgi:hypothetical protein
VHAASTMGLALRRRTELLRPRQPREPRLDRGERTHEAACLQELAAPMAARRQIAVESFLIDLVHMEEGIAGTIVEGGILDVLADDARTLLVAAAEEIGAGLMVRVVGVLISVRVVLQHDDPLRKRRAPWKRHLAWLDGQIADLSEPLTKATSLWRTERDSVPRYSLAVDLRCLEERGIGPEQPKRDVRYYVWSKGPSGPVLLSVSSSPLDPKPISSNRWRFPQGSSQQGDCPSAAQELNVDWLLIL